MKVHFQKVMCMLLVASLCLSMTAFAVGYIYEPDPGLAAVFDVKVTGYFFDEYGKTDVTNVSSRLKFPFFNKCTSDEMKQSLDYYNQGGFWKATEKEWAAGLVLDKPGYASVEFDSERGIYRLYDVFLKAWIVQMDGNFPYCEKDTWEHGVTDGNVPAQDIYTAPGTANKFVGVRSADQKSPVIVSYDVLSAACVSLNDQGIACSLVKMPINGVRFWVIYQLNSSDGSYYCNSLGRPFVANIEPTVTDNKFDYIVNDNSSTDNSDNSITINDSQIIDLTNGVLNMITENGDRVSYNIDDVSYNFDDRSYTVNAYDITYNTTNNYYEYNYYTYNISYTYNNTYVTYIGSTAEYQPTEYELYYELPDGRSSADLTAEDIAGLSFEFYDCVNYAKSATDTSLRALYHFDGDTDDSSFFSTQGAFTWNKGASITYMDSNAFNGTLYLDEKEHEFVITLPSGVGSGDFTLQWRYYQNAATTTEHNENYVMFGGTKLLGWSEQNLYSMGTTKIAPLSVGTWQELALVRDKGTLCFYHNGLKVGSVSFPSGLGHEITFHLGPSSRAYSMMDELRGVNFAVAKDGASYPALDGLPFP